MPASAPIRTVGAALYTPFAGTPMFVRGLAGASQRTFNFVQDGAVVAEYRERRASFEGDVGVNLSRESELFGGIQVGNVSDEVRAGNPGCRRCLAQRSGRTCSGCSTGRTAR